MIGGEFEIDQALLLPGAPGAFEPASTFSSGRAALHAIIRDAMQHLGVQHVLLPEYLCGSMVQSVEDAGCDYSYYRVGDDLLPDMSHLIDLSQADTRRCAVVLVNYFGITDAFADAAQLRELKRPPVVVADLSQAAFRFAIPDSADYAFTTLRKSLPTPDGAPILSRVGRVAPPRDGEAAFVAEKVLGNTIKARAVVEGLEDDEYLRHTRSAEQLLDLRRFYECRMSDTSATILGHLDLRQIAERRRANFLALQSLIEPAGLRPIRPLEGDAVPLFLPILVPDRDGLRRALAAERIFCPVHWPWPAGLAIEPPRPEIPLWSQELSLVIDQRYSEPEMRRMASVIARALGRE